MRSRGLREPTNLEEEEGTMAWGRSKTEESAEATIPAAERYLTLLLEGMALNVLEIDPDKYRRFRSDVGRLGMQLADRLPDADKLALLQTIVHEFENYRVDSDKVLRERYSAWRLITSKLLRELLSSLGIDATTIPATQLLKQLASVTTTEEIQAFPEVIEAFLHPPETAETAGAANLAKKTDRSTSNDNAGGLPGGGAAVERVRQITEKGGKGFLVLFRLSCLEVISQRFGVGAVEDCVMSVSAFLTSTLHSDDAIFHWSDAALLAVLQGRVSEPILTAELNRLVNQNRETSVTIGDRTIMLRIPISFDIRSIDSLRAPEDLLKMTWSQSGKR
jgi:hypothetical protein